MNDNYDYNYEEFKQIKTARGSENNEFQEDDSFFEKFRQDNKSDISSELPNTHRKKQFENELSNEDWEHVLTLDDISPNDYDVPELFGNRKKEKELQPIFMDAETEILEQTEIIHRTAPIHIATKKKQSPPYVEMAIAFAGTFCTLLLLWSLLS